MWHNESLDCRRPLSITVENGRVTPLFKKHDKSKNKYYRPVTVLPALNNIFKRLLSFQTSKFYSSIIIVRFHFGIQASTYSWSCETSLIRLTDDWRRCLNNKEIVAVVSMDLSKAFDTIRHQLLIAKLRAYGIDDSGCALLSNYLTGRMQRMKVDDTSDWMCVRKGVPQGSFLGPMFFNLFINNVCISDTKTVKLTYTYVCRWWSTLHF